MDRSLGLSEWLQLRLHLLVCAWCARYLKQIRFLRQLLRENNAQGVRQFQPKERSNSSGSVFVKTTPKAFANFSPRLERSDNLGDRQHQF
jgi:hypothetical protein